MAKDDGHDFRIETNKGRFYGFIGWGSLKEAEETMRSLIERAGRDANVEIVIEELVKLKRGPGIADNHIIWFDKDRPPTIGRTFAHVLGKLAEYEAESIRLMSYFTAPPKEESSGETSGAS